MSNIHFKAQSGWINDPNGLCYFEGQYHIFYQYFPYDLKWGTMHWGHATTTDFITYTHHPIALFPSIPADQNGVFSGSALIENNQMNLFFTGVKYNNFSDDIHRYGDQLFISSQLKIRSSDGFTFDNFSGKEIVLKPLERPIGDPIHTRDPKVWKKDDKYYMLLGSNILAENKQQGALLVFKSENLTNFEYLTTCTHDDMGHMWECPDYFEIKEQGFIIMSPEGTLPNCEYPSHVYITKANFDYSSKLEMTNSLDLIDIGLDLYAPQTFTDEHDNRVLISWIRMPEPISDNTIGAFTMPRIINYTDENITYRVHPLVETKFKRTPSLLKLDVNKTYKLECTLSENDYFHIGNYKITYNEGQLKFDRTQLFPIEDQMLKVIIVSEPNQVDLQIYYDGYIVETFINDGSKVCTHVLYNNTDLQIKTTIKYSLYELEV